MSFISQIMGVGQAAAVTDAVLSPLFAAAHRIAESAVHIRVNTDSALALARRVDQLLSILALNIEAGSPVVGDEAIRDAIEPILIEIHETLRARGSQSYISQLLRQHGDSETLKALSDRLQHAFDALTLTMRVELNHSVSMPAQVREASQAFNALRSLPTLAAESTSTGVQAQ